MNDYDKQNIGNILVNNRGRWDWFTCHLFRVIAKADENNRSKFRELYPDELEAFEKWKKGESGKWGD